MAVKSNRRTVSFEEVALSNMLTLNALVELLDERGILSRQDVLDRVTKLRGEMTVKHRPQ
jgi:hypothetical protein